MCESESVIIPLNNRLMELSSSNSDYVVIRNGVYINALISRFGDKLNELNMASKQLIVSLSNGDLWSERCQIK